MPFTETANITFLETKFDTEFQMSLDGKINGRAEVKVLEENVLRTAKCCRESIWPLRGWKFCLRGFIEAIKDKVTML